MQFSRRQNPNHEKGPQMSLNSFLIVLAVVFLFLAAFKTPEPTRLSFGWAGMALWMLTIAIGIKF